jgi:uncharacterized membrane protein YqaE (UPF0057 family)
MAERAWLPRFHDPSLRLSLRDQVELHWDANLRMLRDWRACWDFTWVSLLPVPIMCAAILVPPATAFTDSARAGLVIGICLLVAYFPLQHWAFWVAMRRSYIPFVRQALCARGHHTCIACGHLLGPEPPLDCPECGAATPRPR